MKRNIIFLLLVSLPCIVWAARPLATDDAPLVSLSHWEIEFGCENINNRDSSNSSAAITSIKYGLLPNLDFGCEIPYALSGNAGVGDIVAKAKLGITDVFSLGFNVKLTNGNVSAGLGSGQVDYSVLGILSKETDFGLLHFNLGFTLPEKNSPLTPRDTLLYRTAWEYQINDSSALVVELIGSTQPDPAVNSNPLELLVGVIKIAIYEVIILDFGLDFGLSEASPANKSIVGVTVKI